MSQILMAPCKSRRAFLHRPIVASLLCAAVSIALRVLVARKPASFAKPALFTNVSVRPRKSSARMPERRSALRRAWPDPQMQQVAADALSAYGDSLATNPVPTKLLTAAFLVTLGDACSQLTESSGEDLKYDWNRGLSFAIFGAVYTGAFQHWWFLFLNSVVQVAPDAGDLELWLAAAAKTGLCQFGTIPLVYLPLFFLLTGALRGLTLEQSMARARSSYLPLFWRNIAYWIPVQMAQFLIVDPEWQVPYVCSAGFVWSIFLSRFAGPIQQADSQSESQAYPEKGSEVHFQLPDADKESPVLLHRLQTRLHLEHRPEDEKAARVLGDHVAHAGVAPTAHESDELEELVALEPVLSDGE